MELAPLQALLGPAGEEVLAAAAALPDPFAPTPAQVAGLRRLADADLCTAAIELVRARAKGAARFVRAVELVADPEGVEQASGSAAAAWKARRYAALDPPPERIHDLCCGIGGDAMALAGVAPVKAVDRNPLRAFMAGRNARCQAVVGDALAELAPGGCYHLDPDRRAAGRRRRRFADYEPPPAVIGAILAKGGDGAVKLGPGLPLEEIPAGPGDEVEILGGPAGLLQAVWWRGRLAFQPGVRTASRLTDGPGAWLHVPHPALERAGLVGARIAAAGLALAQFTPGLGLLTGPEPAGDPWFGSYRILARMPWREARIRHWLAAHDAGQVTVRTRGGAVDANRAQLRLRGDGSRHLVLFGLRLGVKRVALITEGGA